MADLDDFGVGTIIAIVVAALLAASLVPPAIGAATSADFSERTDNFQLQEGGSYNVSDTNVTVTLDSVNATGANNANYTFTDGDTGGTETRSLSEGENSTVSLDGITYTVNATNVNSADNSATLLMEWQSPDSGGVAQDLWNMIPLFMVLAVALFFVAYATSGSGKTDL